MSYIIDIQVNAKINLCLDVRGKRPDGYHEISSLFHSLDLFDRLSIARSTEKALITDDLFLPTDGRNLIMRALLQLEKELQRELNCTFRLEKNIPVSAGLGGGSSNAAGALILANRLYDLNLDDEDLARIGSKIGADVPFMIYGGAALVSGIGEKIVPVQPGPPLGILLIKPPFGINTKAAYDLLDENPASLLHFDPAVTYRALNGDDPKLLQKALGNTFQAPIFAKCPSLVLIAKTLNELGISSVNLAGSGPTLYALTDKCNIIKELEVRLKEKIPGWKWIENQIPGGKGTGELIVCGENIKPWIKLTALSGSGWR